MWNQNNKATKKSFFIQVLSFISLYLPLLTLGFQVSFLDLFRFFFTLGFFCVHLSSVRGETEHKNYGSMVCHIIEAPENNKKSGFVR